MPDSTDITTAEPHSSVPVSADGAAGLDGLDGYPHRWAGSFPRLPAEVPRTDARPDTFAAALAELALTIKGQGAKGEDHAMTVIVEGAAAIITGAEYAAVVVSAGPRQLVARAAYGDLPAQLMDLQNLYGEGPCLPAVQDASQVVVPDLGTEPRWFRFTPAASACGAVSMLCTPLPAGGATYGALMLISGQLGAFDDDSAALAAVFAAHAALALTAAREVRNLTAMADTRDSIGQAKGILMERHHLTADEAFQLLVRTSQTSNTKLRDLSDHLTTTGRLPTAN